jgi:hypothetical protein
MKMASSQEIAPVNSKHLPSKRHGHRDQPSCLGSSSFFDARDFVVDFIDFLNSPEFRLDVLDVSRLDLSFLLVVDRHDS